MCKKVYSIEPQPFVFMQLCCNLFLNQCFNVTPLNYGILDKTCRLDFAEYQDNSVKSISDYTKTRNCAAVSLEEKEDGKIQGEKLDNLINERVDFIKYDLGGADISAILGSERLIREYRPATIFEYQEEASKKCYGKSMVDLEIFAKKINYEIVRIGKSGDYLMIPL